MILAVSHQRRLNGNDLTSPQAPPNCHDFLINALISGRFFSVFHQIPAFVYIRVYIDTAKWYPISWYVP